MEFVQLLPLAQTVAHQLHKDWDERLTVILRYCSQSPQQKAFPVIAKITLEQNPEPYLTRYLQRYYLAREQKLTLKAITTVPDPAVDVILQAFGQLDDFSKVSLQHRQSMAAENLLGELLERYIAERLESHGWVWCAGNTVRAVDFCVKTYRLPCKSRTGITARTVHLRRFARVRIFGSGFVFIRAADAPIGKTSP